MPTKILKLIFKTNAYVLSNGEKIELIDPDDGKVYVPHGLGTLTTTTRHEEEDGFNLNHITTTKKETGPWLNGKKNGEFTIETRKEVENAINDNVVSDVTKTQQFYYRNDKLLKKGDITKRERCANL